MQRVAKIFTSPVVIVLVLVAVGTLWATKDQWTWLLEDGSAQTVGAVAPALERAGPVHRAALSHREQRPLVGHLLGRGDPGGNLEDRGGYDPGARGRHRGEHRGSLAEPSRARSSSTSSCSSRTRPCGTSAFGGISWTRGVPDGHLRGRLHRRPSRTPSMVRRPPSSRSPVISPSRRPLRRSPSRAPRRSTDDELTATMTGTVLMSDYGVGPINVAGLVRTGDEVALTLDLVAERTEIGTPAPSGAVLVLPGAEIPDGEFAEVVQPIIEARCASCHTDGGAGNHTVEMDTAGDVAEIADEIKLGHAVPGTCPRGRASELGVPMKHDFSIDADEIDTIAEWARRRWRAGRARGHPDRGRRPAPTIRSRKTSRRCPRSPTPARSTVPTTTAASSPRCRIRRATAPGSRASASNPMRRRWSTTRSSPRSHRRAAPKIEELDAADQGSGFTCFGQIAAMGGVKATGLGGWTPGRQPTTLPEGIGIYLEPGSFIVNQIHYHYDHDDLAGSLGDRARHLQLRGDRGSGGRRHAPAEPYRQRLHQPGRGAVHPEESGPSVRPRCGPRRHRQRSTGRLLRFLPDLFVRSCGGTVDDYDDLDGTTFHSSCDHDVNYDRHHLLACFHTCTSWARPTG